MSEVVYKDERFANRVALGIGLPVIVLLGVALWRQIYLQQDVMHVLSYFTSDRPPLPFDEITNSWGNHFFGDYAMNYWFARSSTFSIDLMYGTPWFPAAFLFLLPFTLLNYSTGLYLFLITSSLGVISSGIHALKTYSISEKLFFLLLVLLSSGPVIAAIDRGNEVLFLVPLVYVYFIAILRNSTFSIYAVLALIVGLKPHMILLVFLLPVGPNLLARYTKAVISVVGFQFFGFIFASANPITRVHAILESANRVASESVFLNSRSFGSFLAGISSLTSHGDLVERWSFEQRNLISTVSVFIVLTIFFLFKRKLPIEINALVICGLVIFALPLSPPYNSVIVLPVLLLRFYNGRRPLDNNSHGAFWDRILVVVVACHVLPIPFVYRNGVSLSTLLSPISYLILIACVISRQCRRIDRLRSKRLSLKVFMTVGVVLFGLGLLNSPIQNKELMNSDLVSKPIEFGSVSSICEFISGHHGAIQISFKSVQTASGSYQDFFQTDDMNYGIRIERDLDGKVSLIIGNASGKFVGIGVPVDVRTRKLDGLAIIRPDGTYSLEVNNVRTQSTEPVFNPSCSRVMVGRGFDDGRKWIGQSQVTVVGVRNLAWRNAAQALQMVWISLALLNLLQLLDGFKSFSYRDFKSERFPQT
jgi:hypothetical protein